MPSFVLCAKKNSIQHPTLEWVQIRYVDTFGKWHEGVNGGELMGYIESI